MVHDDRARPVSGEIMSAVAMPGKTHGSMHGRAVQNYGAEDICDAQFEIVSWVDRPASRPEASSFVIIGPPAIAGPIDGMGFLKQGERVARRGARGGPVFWLAGLFAVGLAFWVSGGHALVAEVSASAPARAPLRIAGVASRIEAHGGRDVLFVDGRAENHGDRALALPSIEIAVAGQDGIVTRYRLGRRATQLDSGDRYVFSSRLEVPGGGVRTVSVAFAEEGS